MCSHCFLGILEVTLNNIDGNLRLLEHFYFDGLDVLDVKTVHVFAQAGRVTFADRNLYVADYRRDCSVSGQ